jgi:hypothetical protein
MSVFLDLLLRNDDNIGFKLIPHIEEAAMKYVIYNSVMARRVTVKSEMSGWNVRKVSEYIRSRRAQTLAEDTAIPDTSLLRVRKALVEPYEVGDKYRVSDRRAETDLESIMTDVVTAIGEAVRERVEVDLLTSAGSSFIGGEFGSASTDYSLGLMLQASALFRARARHGNIYHVVHPFQALTEMEKLIEYSNATQQADLTFRDRAASGLMTTDLRSFSMPTFGITDLSISEMLPRRVTYKIHVTGDGGTFRLQLGNGHDSATPKNITAAITVSTTAATMATNIQTALNALDMSDYYSGVGTWVVTGSDIADLTITPPADFYIADSDALRVANKYDEDAVLVSDLGTILMKSAYDLVANPDGTLVDKDGVSVGLGLFERAGATAKSLFFHPEALVWDVRKGMTSFFGLPDEYSGRTAEFSGYMVYGVGEWSPERGAFITTKAESPLAVA